MPSLTRVMILYCGQGMTTMVEVYDDGVVKETADYLAKAKETRETGVPLWVYLVSASQPRRPTRIALFALRSAIRPPTKSVCSSCTSPGAPVSGEDVVPCDR